MNEIKRNTLTNCEKFVCDWTNEKNYLVHYRMLKFYVRLGMIVEKVHEILSFRQSNWWEKFIKFNTQKELKLRMILIKIAINYYIMLLSC